MKEAVQVLSELAGSAYLLVLRVNLTDDTFEILHDSTCCSLDPNTLTGTFRNCLSKGMIHPDHVVDFRAYTDTAYLAEFFRTHHGSDIFFQMYRWKNGDSWSWMTLEVMSAEDYSEDHETVYLFIKDIGASEKSHSVTIRDTFRALCENFDSVYYLDLQDESIVPFRAESHDVESFVPYLRTKPGYRDLMGRYIGASVLPEDRSYVGQITDPDYMKQHLKLKNSYTVDFRVQYDGDVCWYRIKFARIDAAEADLRFVAVGLTEISDEKRMELDFYRNRQMVLLVDHDEAGRTALAGILGESYPVLEAGDSAQALAMLEEQHENVAVVIADWELPGGGCLDLLHAVSADFRFRCIPVVVGCSGDGRDVEEKCLGLGASDLIRRPYNPAVVRSRVSHLVEYREAVNSVRLTEKDPLTDLYRKEGFYKISERIIRNNPHKNYVIMVSCVENFRLFNDHYGVETGNALIRELAYTVPLFLRGFQLGCRLETSIFGALIEDNEDFRRRLECMQAENSYHFGDKSVSMKHGIYTVREKIPIITMCDRAIFAVTGIMGVYGKNVAEYDEHLRDKMERQRHLVDIAEACMDGNQFKVYYQPKFDLATNSVGGAEALVRWIHPEYGFMNPAEFIPLFEKNGFVGKVDRFTLNEVCRMLVRWKETGEKLVPVSVNLSQVDFEQDDMADEIIRDVDSYGLDHSLIHFEITESSCANAPEAVINGVTALHEAGFVIELDDFGTGYSSLSSLKAMPIDVLKMDMSLLRGNGIKDNSEILECSVNLARMMNMKTVQEGVETESELEYVRSLGCNYVQGYYFSRPVPEEEFQACCRALNDHN